jgi:hypothetical protein
MNVLEVESVMAVIDKLTIKHRRFCIHMVHLIRGTSKVYFARDLNSLLLFLR